MAARDSNSTSVSEIEGSSCSIQISESEVDSSSQATQKEETGDSDKNPATPLRQPSLHLISGKKGKLYCSMCLSLYKAALRGDFEEAKILLEKDYRTTLCAAITGGHQTLLHVATGAKQTSFVKELLKLMDPEDLMLQDKKGNTAFCFAAAVGAVEIAKIMVLKNPSLLTIRGGENMTPLYLAALFGQKEMASFLFRISENELTTKDRKATFFISISTGLHDLALTLFMQDRELALARHVKHGTALHMLARNPSAFATTSPGLLKRLINYSGRNFSQRSELMSPQALNLVKCIWKEIIQQEDVDVAEVIRKPSNLLFDAAQVGNYKFLAELIGSYPDLVHELDENGRSIFHVAILHRHMSILNLIHEQGFNKQLLVTYEDKSGNNMLHLAAKYPNASKSVTWSGAALEMRKELLTYKKVEMLVPPSCREMKNSEGRTPRELFTIEHMELLRSGEQGMKNRAISCMIVAALIAVIIFSAAITVPGGKDDKTGMPIHLTETWFKVFAISDAVALSCSVVSVALFLSILTSRFAEDDFVKSLPVKLLVGLSALFMSIISMLVAFSSTFFLAYDHGLNWVIVLSTLLAFVPTAVIVPLQYPVLKEIFCSGYCPRF